MGLANKMDMLRRAIRAALDARPDDWVNLAESVAESDELLRAYVRLSNAALMEVVNRRFPDGLEFPDVVNTVAEMRVRSGANGPELEPRVAEVLLRAALGEEDAVNEVETSNVDAEVKARTQHQLIRGLVADFRYSESEMEELVDQVFARAQLSASGA